MSIPGLNLVHVDDVAAGHIAAWQKGRIGERYILGGQDVLLGDMLREIARQVGRAPPKLRLPRRLIFPIAYAAEAIAHFTGREPFVTTPGCGWRRITCFYIGQGRARAWLQRAAVSRGGRRRHRLVSAARLSEVVSAKA